MAVACHTLLQGCHKNAAYMHSRLGKFLMLGIFVHKPGLPIIIFYLLSCRYNGRQILYLLMTHQDFDKMLSKHLPANTLRNIRDIVETLKVKVRYIFIDSF